MKKKKFKGIVSLFSDFKKSHFDSLKWAEHKVYSVKIPVQKVLSIISTRTIDSFKLARSCNIRNDRTHEY